jgi:peptidylprolyl isomerase
MISNRLTLPLALLAFTAAATAQNATTTTTLPKKPATPGTTTTPVHHTPAATTAATPATPTAVACSKIPTLSPKIPALPPGLPCAKPLYTITTTPAVQLSYVSPIESTKQLAETLGIESSTFSLDYVDIKVGTGELAAPHKWYSIHYTGYLVDGTKFDSSLDRNEPINIPYGGHKVIPGWDTGFDGMRVGGKRRLFIPYQLAYGAQGKPPVIPAQSELIFDVELVAQSDTEPVKPEPAPAPPADSAKPSAEPAKPPVEGVPVTP